MKKLFTLIAICIVACASQAGIQIATVYNGGTNNLAAGQSLTNNLPSATANTNYQAAVSFYGGTSQDLYLQLSGGYANSTAGTGTVTLQLMQSADNVIWTNANTIVLSMLASTTNAQLSWATNINDCAPFYCVSNVVMATNSTGAGALTNLLLKAFTKTGI